MAGSVLGNRTRNFVLRLVVNGGQFTQSEVPNGTALPLVIEKLRDWHQWPRQSGAGMLIRVLAVVLSALESGAIGLHGGGACESGEIAGGDSLAGSTASAEVTWEP